MHGSEIPAPLVGRDNELAALLSLLDDASGTGGALVLRGPAGVGASRLLAEAGAAGTTRGLRVLSYSGTRVEAGTPFAGLHHLVQPVLNGIGDLPAPHREAVLGAFGMFPVDEVNPLFVALGVLDLFTAAAANTKLLLLIDDAHWLDDDSARVLAVIARRLAERPIVMVLAIRSGLNTLVTAAALPTRQLDPLEPAPARALLAASAPRLGPSERKRVLADAAGNPLALTELPRLISAEGAAPSGLPGLSPLTSALLRAFGTGGHDLLDATRMLLLIAAANDGDEIGEVLRAGVATGVDQSSIQALEPAEAAGVIEVVGPRLRFTHPLTRRAVYHEASPADRIRAHRALATALADRPGRRTWHTAATATAPDEDLAVQLEDCARQALREGSTATATAMAERFVQVTADPAQHGGRLLRAAELAYQAGRAGIAGELAAMARAAPLFGADQTRLAWLAHATGERPGGEPDVRLLTDLAGRARRDGQPDLALNILESAATVCFSQGLGVTARHRIAAAISTLPATGRDAARLSALAMADPLGRWLEVTAALTRRDHDTERPATDLLSAGIACTAVGDMETGIDYLTQAAALLRLHSDDHLLARALTIHAWAASQIADQATATPAAQEGTRLALETDQPAFATVGLCTQLMAAAQRGEPETEALALRAERLLASRKSRYWFAVIQQARGLAALGTGRHEAAYEHLRRIFDPDDQAGHPVRRCWAMADLAEAAVRSGHDQEAREYLTEVEAAVGRAPVPLLQTGLAYARLVIGGEAENDFSAVSDTELTRQPMLWARASLAQGIRLRRQRRITESRRPLRSAAESFDFLGAAAWADRARQEMRAAGVGGDPLHPHVDLSPQELRIAKLAADGLSNRQIAQQLYVSPRTVSAHLYRMFPKLGITSRFQIPRALQNVGSSDAPDEAAAVPKAG